MAISTLRSADTHKADARCIRDSSRENIIRHDQGGTRLGLNPLVYLKC
jgi:hypothetical protein